MARNNRRAKGKRSSLPLLGFVVIIILLVVVGGLLYIDGLNKPFDSENKEYISISIPMGTATQSIGKILEEEGIIKDSQRFKWYAKIHGYNGELEAGDYLLSPSMTMEEIMNMMTEGFSQASRFVIQEGLTIKQVAESLEKSGMTTVDDFLYEVENGDFDYIFMDFLPGGPSRLEGFLMPNTYDVPMGSDAHFIINTMLAQFNKIYKDDYYSRATVLGYDINQIITIASMIERETRVEAERTISQYIVNEMFSPGSKNRIDNPISLIRPAVAGGVRQTTLLELSEGISEINRRIKEAFPSISGRGVASQPINATFHFTVAAESIKSASSRLTGVLPVTGIRGDIFGDDITGTVDAVSIRMQGIGYLGDNDEILTNGRLLVHTETGRAVPIGVDREGSNVLARAIAARDVDVSVRWGRGLWPAPPCPSTGRSPHPSSALGYRLKTASTASPRGTTWSTTTPSRRSSQSTAAGWRRTS